MELIKVNSLKLKIILSPIDVEELGLKNENIDCEESLSMKAFREILEKAKEQTGFESGYARLYVQYYPSKDGGGEMFITRRSLHFSDSKVLHINDESSFNISSTYITFFNSSENLISLCKRLKADNFKGKSVLYSCMGKYIIVLNGKSDENFNTYLSEYGKSFVSDNLRLAFLNEHAKILCESQTVETFCEIFDRSI